MRDDFDFRSAQSSLPLHPSSSPSIHQQNTIRLPKHDPLSDDDRDALTRIHQHLLEDEETEDDTFLYPESDLSTSDTIQQGSNVNTSNKAPDGQKGEMESIILPEGKFPRKRFSNAIQAFGGRMMVQLPVTCSSRKSLVTKKAKLLSSLTLRQRTTIDSGSTEEIDKIVKMLVKRVSEEERRDEERAGERISFLHFLLAAYIRTLGSALDTLW
jgi:hypothetical protein